MEKSVIINNQHLSLRSYNGQNVVTLKDIDLVHGRSEGTAHRNFKTNKRRFVEGIDFFRRNSSEAKKEFGISAPNGLYLLPKADILCLPNPLPTIWRGKYSGNLLMFISVQTPKHCPKMNSLPSKPRNTTILIKLTKANPSLLSRTLNTLQGLELLP